MQGLLWVKMTPLPPGGESKAPPELLDTSAIPTIPEYDQRKAVGGKYAVLESNFDQPHDYLTVVENVLDPAHLDFTHFGRVKEQDRADACLRVHLEEFDKETGFIKGRKKDTEVTFYPPSLITYEQRKNKVHIQFCVYLTPTKPGWHRIIVKFYVTFDNPLLEALVQLKPAWLDHMDRKAVLDDDVYLLHRQEREYSQALDTSAPHYLAPRTIPAAAPPPAIPASPQASPPLQNGSHSGNIVGACQDDKAPAPGDPYYSLNDNDVMVHAMRAWVETMGGGPFGHQGRQWRTLLPAIPRERQLSSRYECHVKNCRTCKAALANIDRALSALSLLQPLALALGAALLAAHLASAPPLPSALASLPPPLAHALAAARGAWGLAAWAVLRGMGAWLEARRRRFFEGEEVPKRNLLPVDVLGGKIEQGRVVR